MPPTAGSGETFDALIVGAGAAGLSAARALGGAGWRVAVLEARPRAGGRIHTLNDPAWPLPVELGAEFIHGEGADVRAAADAAGLPVEELPDVHVLSEQGRWRRSADFYGEIASVLRPAARLRRDTSFADYLRSRRLPRRRKDLACLYVEGYTAAPVDTVSARWLAAGALEDEGSQRQHRVVAGFGALVRWLTGALDRGRVALRLNTIASRVEWRPGAVTVYGRTVTGQRLPPFRARTVVMTVPLGVLKAAPGQAGAIEFVPPLSSKQAALALLQAGHVCKVALRFRDRFWEERRFLAERLPSRPAGVEGAPINFWHDGRLAFPTWWTSAPQHAPVLTAWAGGPPAEALLGRPEADLVGRSLEALAALMRLSRATLEARLESWAGHDWRADPYSRGAYSYAAVGGESAARTLARPVGGTLFFAGEATETDETGTVQAALASGQRVAREMMRSRRE